MKCAVLLCITLFTVINAQRSSSISVACQAATNCTECMAAHKHCNWCITNSADNQDWSDSNLRCDAYDILIVNGCGADNITNITTVEISTTANKVRDAVDDDNPAIQLSPQKLSIKLRPNEKVRVNVTFRLAKDYPVDLYYLMDLSQSMADDKKKVANLGINLAAEMRKITKDVRLGFGSFVDKVLMPYVNTLPERLSIPCSDCESPYSFKHRLELTQDTSVFALKVNGTQVSGNLDEPEGGFDALMQAIVCDNVIGWRPNSRKMLIFSTDAPFHSAGDGKLGGVLEPNDGLCHMSNNEYTWGGRQDYPSISQIASKVADNRMNVIFAVTQDQTERYGFLSNIIPGSVTGQLANDSSNIVQLVKENYQKISSKVVMKVKREDKKDFLNVKIRADCNNDDTFSDQAECGNLAPSGSVQFQVEIQATSCAKAKNGRLIETFEVYPTGLAETFEITAEVDCACACDDTVYNSAECSDVGMYRCGICECGDETYGEQCQCDWSNVDSDSEDLHAPCKRPSNSSQSQQVCSGRGECVCGKCEACNCLISTDDKSTCRRFTGKYCQCNPNACPRNSKGVCSNNGDCVCDEETAVHTCQCEEGYTGNECNCLISDATCRDPSNPKEICNGHGPCNCGQCACLKTVDGSGERYTGQYCEECSTCASKCQQYKQCVQCTVHEQLGLGWESDTYDPAYCLETCSTNGSLATNFTLVSEIPEGAGMTQCPGYTSALDDCKVMYGYEYKAGTGRIAYIKNTQVCPYKPNVIAIVVGVIGGIVILGIVALLIWKLVTSMHDKKSLAEFEKERKKAKWNTSENPIYVEATSTFKNPMYQGSMKKSQGHVE